jgi:hypothetical protein
MSMGEIPIARNLHRSVFSGFKAVETPVFMRVRRTAPSSPSTLSNRLSTQNMAFPQIFAGLSPKCALFRPFSVNFSHVKG